MTDEPIDAYKTLQVDPEAEDEVIQAAYRRLAQKYHPDVSGPSPESARRMAALNRAWETLRDPVRRRAYDRERRSASHASQWTPTGGPSTSTPAASSSHGRRAPEHGGARHTEAPGGEATRPPDTVSTDWTSGRSSHGGGYDPAVMGKKDGFAAAGRPPGDPSGSVLNFGRFAGWSLGEIARRDLEYLEWLDRSSIGRQYRDEIDAILRRVGRRRSASPEEQKRRGLFRR
ncbi:MAG TPA: J domain-containing protein [Candidatus Limnocylindrales bacterium]|jgi:curved DNA-binding protein CbpA|nr:J domain-containing protein [Candidatus Limnocylindrales bacterium]